MEIIARMANPPEDLVSKYSRSEKEFFFDYATYVLSLLHNYDIQRQLRLLTEAENVHFKQTIDLRVMVFPARPLHGRPRNVLHGSYNQDNAQISLYPLKLRRDWIRREGDGLFRKSPDQLTRSQSRFLRDAFKAAVCTLIHEVLHVKLEGRNLPRYAEEAIVRKLEAEYSHQWMESLPVSLVESSLPVAEWKAGITE